MGSFAGEKTQQAFIPIEEKKLPKKEVSKVIIPKLKLDALETSSRERRSKQIGYDPNRYSPANISANQY